MKPFVIVKTGDTLPSISAALDDFEDWIKKGLALDPEKIQVTDVSRGDRLPAPETCSGTVITGSHAMITENRTWSLETERWVQTLVRKRIPVLGICYGHQLLARAMGGTVDFHAGGLEIGTTRIQRLDNGNSDILFRGLPEQFDVHTCHSQTVVHLPEDAVLLAKNDFEPHHAFRLGSSAWGLQFHPEYNDAIMSAYVENMRDQIDAAGQDLAGISARVRPTPAAAELLHRFGRLMNKTFCSA